MYSIGKMLTLLLAAALLAACAPAAPEPVSLRIEMSEFAFSPETIEVKAGQQVIIELVNTGVIEHEIMFGREVVKNHNRPSGYRQDLFETANVMPTITGVDQDTTEDHGDMNGTDHQGFMLVLPNQGDTATISFTATKEMAGEWEMGCFEQDGVHYDAGMLGKFIVQP